MGFFADDDDAVGAVVAEVGPKAVEFKLRWG